MRYINISEKKAKKGYTGYLLSEKSRVDLTAHFPPKYPKFIGHHATHKFGAYEGDSIPEIEKAEIIGYAEEDGIEALVVKINGSTFNEISNSIYHITWSLDPNKKSPKDSNKLIASKGFKDISPISIELTPEFFPF